MRNAIFAGIAVIGFAAVASGSTLSIVPDKPVYLVGETITVKVVGDALGEVANGVYGCLVYSGSGSVRPSTQVQKLIGVEWYAGWIGNGSCPSDPYGPPHNGCASGGFGFSEVFNQVMPEPNQTTLLINPTPQTSNLLPLGNPFSTVTLIATAPGVVNVGWCSDTEWFSTTSATAGGTSFVSKRPF